MEYQELINKILRLLENTKYVILATANKKGIVSASKMCIVNDGLKIYIQTDNRFEKIQNIKENENVAINIDTVYFKGIARIIGHPSENKMFVEKMKEKHFETYENYTNLPNQVLIKIELTECRMWKFEVINGKREEIIKIVNLKDKSINNIICDKLKEGY